MTRDDESTRPLPAADLPGAPGEPTEPLVAPHVPLAQVSTAQLSTMAPDSRRGSGARRLAIVGLVSVAAAIIAVLVVSGLQRGAVPVPSETTAPPAAPVPSTPQDPVSEDPVPVQPPPAEPAPEPTVPPEPTEPPTDPPAEPTPEPTP